MMITIYLPQGSQIRHTLQRQCRSTWNQGLRKITEEERDDVFTQYKITECMGDAVPWSWVTSN